MASLDTSDRVLNAVAQCQLHANGIWLIEHFPVADLNRQIRLAASGDRHAKAVMHCFEEFAESLFDTSGGQTRLCLFCSHAIRISQPDSPAAMILVRPDTDVPVSALVYALCQRCYVEDDLELIDRRIASSVALHTGMLLQPIDLHQPGHA